MTQREFFAHLANIKGFRIGYDTIRKGDYCPVTAVCRKVTGKKHPVCYYQDAARALGLRFKTAARIADAADNVFLDRLTSQVRQRLLRTLGLKEEA